MEIGVYNGENAVCMIENAMKKSPPSEVEYKGMIAYIREQLDLSELPKDAGHSVLIHTGGELDYMERTSYELDDYNGSPTHPKKISLVNFITRSSEIRQMSKEDLHTFMPENPQWMEGAIACNAIAQALAEHLGVNEIIPSNKNLNDGLLLMVVDRETRRQ